MDTQPLLNLLLASRKRSALSQDEVAYLLGVQSGAKVSRYERMAREPELPTALALEAIFGRSVSELFPGLFGKVQLAVRERAKQLQKKEIRGSSKSFIDRKRETVSTIAN